MLEAQSVSRHNRKGVEESKFLTPFQKQLLLKTLREDVRSEYRQRIQIMLLADEGYSQSEICTELGCCQETARYWISVAQNGRAHHWNCPPVGRPSKSSDCYQQRLKELISHNPRDYGYPFTRWTAQWLSRHLATEFGVEYSTRHIYRLLKKIGVSSRPKKQGTTDTDDNTSSSHIVIGYLQPVSQ